MKTKSISSYQTMVIKLFTTLLVSTGALVPQTASANFGPNIYIHIRMSCAYETSVFESTLDDVFTCDGLAECILAWGAAYKQCKKAKRACTGVVDFDINCEELNPIAGLQ